MSHLVGSASKTNMQYRYLGSTGVKVSELCLGAMTFSIDGTGPFGGLPACNEKTSHAIMDEFVAQGGNFIDTADCYGQSEECIGRWLSTKGADFRDKLVIATKVRNQVGDHVNSEGLSRKHILRQIEVSLKRLQTSYVDLLQVHLWDAGTPLRETLEALTDLVRAGKVRYIGCSNYNAWHIVESLRVSERYNLLKFVTIQPQYSLLARNIEYSIVEVCQREDLGILPWSPLCGGWLSGKYKQGVKEPEQNSRVAWADKAGWEATDFASKNNERTWKILGECEAIAKVLNTTVAAVALRWVIQRPKVSSVIIGAKTVDQLKQNLLAASIKLDDKQMERLNKVSETGVPGYPWAMINPFNAGRVRPDQQPIYE